MLSNCSGRCKAWATPTLEIEPHGQRLRQQLCIAKAQRPILARGCIEAVGNNSLTDSRERATIVNAPRIVPNGTKRHSMQAITSANEYPLRRDRHRPAIRMQIAM